MSETNGSSFSLKPLLRFGQERNFELRRPDGRTVFSLSLTWLAGLGILALITHLFVPAVIAAIVLLVLKFEFVVSRTET